MDELTMKLVDRLIAAERMNLIYETRFKSLNELIWEKEREHAAYCKKYKQDYRNSIDDATLYTAEVRKAACIDSELSTIELFRQLDQIGKEEEDE